MRIALIRPVSQSEAYDPEVQEPLGIETLAGYLRADGHCVLVLDPLVTGQSERATARQAAAFQARAVGFSLMSAGDLPSTVRMITELQRYLPQAAFVAGGNLVSTEARLAVNSLPAGTLCVQYEGERPWEQILGALAKGTFPQGISAAAWREGQGAIQATPPEPPLENLDNMPFAERPFLEILFERQMAANVQGSRGCMGACHYCCAPGFPHVDGKRWRGRSPEHIVAELTGMAAQNIKVFNFVDDDFLGAPQQAHARAVALAAELDARHLAVAFGIQARPETLARETIRCLAQAGLSYVFLGLESDDGEVMHAWGRRPTADKVARLAHDLRAQQVEVQVGCIMFHPYSTLERVQRLGRFLQANRFLNYRTITNRLSALPGSRLYAEMHASGQLNPEQSGPAYPAIFDRATAKLYMLLVNALQPLRPAWLYAASRLPALTAYSRVDPFRYGQKALALRQALAGLEQQTERIFFYLLEEAKNRNLDETNLAWLRDEALICGQQANQVLYEHGLVDSLDTLRTAVRIDAAL